MHPVTSKAHFPRLAERRRSITLFFLILAATLLLGTVPLIVADIKYRTPRADHGYTVIYAEERDNAFMAQLELNGDGPGLHGPDIQLLGLYVEYQSG